jgi:F-type H+-transporting ATPase subunit delta
MADDSGIARPYADAVFELAREDGQLGSWSEVLRTASAVVRDDNVQRLIDAPKTDLGALVELIVGVCNAALGEAGPDTGQFVNLLKLLARRTSKTGSTWF